MSSWQTVIDDSAERTEILEVGGRGCLVRVATREGEHFAVRALTWCPGLGSADFGASASATSRPTVAPPPVAPVPAPAATGPAASVVAASPPTVPVSSPQPVPTATAAIPATAPASANDAGPPPRELLGLLRDFARLQQAVLQEFRNKMGVSSGELGFLLHAPQVGRFAVPGEGTWIWRIDQASVTLSSSKRVIELPLPSHLRDDAVEPGAACTYLKSLGHRTVAHGGEVYSVEPQILRDLAGKMAQQRSVRVFTARPQPVYLVA